MAFDGTEGEQLSINEASTMTSDYRAANPNEILGHFMGKDMLNSILSQTGCVGIRSYYALDANGKKELVIVGVDANQNDLVNGIIADRHYPCPNACSMSNALNS